MSEADELLDIEQAARFLNVSETSLRRWTNAGRLACLRVAGGSVVSGVPICLRSWRMSRRRPRQGLRTPAHIPRVTR